MAPFLSSFFHRGPRSPRASAQPFYSPERTLSDSPSGEGPVPPLKTTKGTVLPPQLPPPSFPPPLPPLTRSRSSSLTSQDSIQTPQRKQNPGLPRNQPRIPKGPTSPNPPRNHYRPPSSFSLKVSPSPARSSPSPAYNRPNHSDRSAQSRPTGLKLQTTKLPTATTSQILVSTSTMSDNDVEYLAVSSDDSSHTVRRADSVNELREPSRLIQRRRSNSADDVTAFRELKTRAESTTSSRPATSAYFNSSLNHVFNVVLLPWEMLPPPDLKIQLGELDFSRYVASTVAASASSPRMVLSPSSLRNAEVEEERLKGERLRLNEKYANLLQQRDLLLRNHHVAWENLANLVRRCDRVARQIYLCNDQIRQIELQRKDHLIGCLTAEDKAEEEEKDDPQCETPQHIQVASPVPMVLLRPSTPPDTRPVSLSTVASASRPASSIHVSQLPFPVPPHRPSHLQLLVHPPSSPTMTTALSSDGHEILIYPPGHKRSSSAPLLVSDVPSTPWSDHGHDHARDSLPKILTTAPLRFNLNRANKKVRMKSMAPKASIECDEKKRARRGRESALETPESILLSLATAEFWTKLQQEETW
ncbi:hypothetical protein P7C73_g6001, partial [Tremellales sp. Uapishka_1]